MVLEAVEAEPSSAVWAYWRSEKCTLGGLEFTEVSEEEEEEECTTLNYLSDIHKSTRCGATGQNLLHVRYSSMSCMSDSGSSVQITAVPGSFNP